MLHVHIISLTYNCAGRKNMFREFVLDNFFSEKPSNNFNDDKPAEFPFVFFSRHTYINYINQSWPAIDHC